MPLVTATKMVAAILDLNQNSNSKKGDVFIIKMNCPHVAKDVMSH